MWQQAQATGADLLWRMRSNQRLDPLEVFADGSYLAKVFEVHNYRRRRDGLVVRVIDYTIDDGRDNDNLYQLITTIIDPAQATATELALAYSQRWEIESVFDELKTHQRGPRTVLRSKSPDLVLQEIWGHLCLPLRDPHPDVGSRRPRQRRPGPGQLRCRFAHRPPLHLSGARFFPSA